MARRVDLVVEQGATFKKIVSVLDANGDARDLSGYTARLQARPSADSSVVMVDITPTVDAATSTITITILADDTAAYTWTSGVYDLEISSNGTVERIMEGFIALSPEVTR